MSGKIKSKDLQYDSTLPPFLQRMKAQNSGYGDDRDPDRHETPIARPKKAKNPDDDDGPTMVDESGDTVSKADYEKKLKGDAEGEEDGGSNPQASGALPSGGAPKSEKTISDGTAVRKRKVAKVIGGDDADDAKGDGAEKGSAPKAVKKAKKKAKPVKLSFDDDEET